jgi:NADH-quinone oxidoreductase subunit E
MSIDRGAPAAEILERLRPEFEKRAAPYSHKPSALLALLHAVQEADGYITGDAEWAVAEFLNVGRNAVHEAVTFYTLYKTKPMGKYHVQVCRTLSCDLCGARDLVGVLQKKCGIGEKQVSADGLFSYETVECLGCCELAPAIQTNEDPFKGPLTAAQMEGLIDELTAKAKANGGVPTGAAK